MARHAGNRVFICSESFVAKLDGVDTTFIKDSSRVREGHPILERHGRFFRLIDVHYDVERATAAPGELRT